MDSSVVHTGFDAGALGFWIFLAAIIVVLSWSESRREAEKHETLRRIIEKTGEIDEARLKELFRPASRRGIKPPGEGYRALRVLGTIVMFTAVGIAAASLIAKEVEVKPPERQPIVLPNGRIAPFAFMPQPTPSNPLNGLAAGALVWLIGSGLFFHPASCRHRHHPKHWTSREEPETSRRPGRWKAVSRSPS
jgi:hypothetical protein